MPSARSQRSEWGVSSESETEKVIEPIGSFPLGDDLVISVSRRSVLPSTQGTDSVAYASDY